MKRGSTVSVLIMELWKPICSGNILLTVSRVQRLAAHNSQLLPRFLHVYETEQLIQLRLNQAQFCVVARISTPHCIR